MTTSPASTTGSGSRGHTDNLRLILQTVVSARVVYGCVQTYLSARSKQKRIQEQSPDAVDSSGTDRLSANISLSSSALLGLARRFLSQVPHGDASEESYTISCEDNTCQTHSLVAQATNQSRSPSTSDQCLLESSQTTRLDLPRETSTGTDGTISDQRPANKTRPVRVYMDGCFDCMHFGHANALRQAKALGDVLVVGLNPEAEIRTHKGPPVMTDHERLIAVSSVKWVDEVISDVPYEVSSQFLDTLIQKYNIDIIVHGDDPCIGADGQDVYKAVKDAGRFRTIKRTEGVSSTDIVGRMLLCTRNHHLDHLPEPSDCEPLNEETEALPMSPAISPSPTSVAPTQPQEVAMQKSPNDTRSVPFVRVSTFLPTTRRLIQFVGGPRAPAPGDRVVYCDGTFDMFHAGHIQTLRAARQFGEFLLVGIHDDATVNFHKGSNFPIMNLHERTLSVLSCKYVDEVIIGAPWFVTEDMITTMNISTVVHGTHHHKKVLSDDCDPYILPKQRGIYREVESVSNLTVEEILQRIVRNRDAYVARNARKEKSERDYLTQQKVYVPEV